MIFEQALYHLPEILTGSGYSEQSYESGIVSAFSLAILQALNGRNVPNPISCLHAERPYLGRTGWPPPPGATRPRYLRADLHLKLFNIRVSTRVLRSYGWRLDNWLEAKFFRGESANKQIHTSQLLADLLRLMTLVQHKRAKAQPERELTGRFLLHVYEGLNPSEYLSVNRQIGQASEQRKWLSPLINVGRGECEEITLSTYEAGGVMGQINTNLGDLRIQFWTTTVRIEPIIDLDGTFTQYTCILSRIDSFKISRNQVSLKVRADGVVTETPSSQDVMTEIRQHAGKYISTKPVIEDKEPDHETDDIDESDSE